MARIAVGCTVKVMLRMFRGSIGDVGGDQGDRLCAHAGRYVGTPAVKDIAESRSTKGQAVAEALLSIR